MKTFSIEEITNHSILDNFSTLIYDRTANSKMNTKLNEIIQKGKNSPTSMIDSSLIFNQLKAFKSESEIEM